MQNNLTNEDIFVSDSFFNTYFDDDLDTAVDALIERNILLAASTKEIE